MYGQKILRTTQNSRPLAALRWSLLSTVFCILAVLTFDNILFPDRDAQAARTLPSLWPTSNTDSPPLIARLHKPHPNPFNPQTVIPFRTETIRVVRLTIQDAHDQLVRVLEDRQFSAGTHEVVWNGRDDSGENLPSGLYYACMKTGGVVERRKVLLVK